MQSTITKMRSDAYQITIDGEAAALAAYQKKIERDAEGKSGMLDFKIRDK